MLKYSKKNLSKSEILQVDQITAEMQKCVKVVEAYNSYFKVAETLDNAGSYGIKKFDNYVIFFYDKENIKIYDNKTNTEYNINQFLIRYAQMSSKLNEIYQN
jgi:hypothetical protein